MDDLEVAKQRLKERNLSLVFVKNSESIFETNREGLGGFLQAISELDINLSGAAVADKIVGKAAAFLCAYSNIKAAFALIISESGLEILNKYNIRCQFENTVPTVLNLDKTNPCPFEKLVENITNPQKAYLKLRSCRL